MLPIDLVTSFYDVIGLFDSSEKLLRAISSICQHAGFTYFAITHHDELAGSDQRFIRLHNYPIDLAGYHDDLRLGVRDPVHRASQRTGAGFLWSGLPTLIPLTPEDQGILTRAKSAGLGEGYTVPYHVPGELSGSSSFAVGAGCTFPHHHIPLAQALGSFAFEAARRIHRPLLLPALPLAALTERERQIVILLGHGKPEKEIARILGIAPSTVNDHLAHARARFGVRKSSLLVVCGLLTGSISYRELLAH